MPFFEPGAAFGPGGPAFDVGYVSTRDVEWKAPIRASIEAFWEDYESLCPDPHFLEMAKTDFISAVWQMQLTVLLKGRGFSLVKTNEEGPDISFKRNGKRCWIEAIAPTPGDGADAVPTPRPDFVTHLPEERIILRLRSAIRDKIEQHRAWLTAGLVEQDEPFIIAVNAGKIPGADLAPEVSFMEKALFALGREGWRVEIPSGRISGLHFPFRDRILKRSGAPVQTNIFLNGEAPLVSGVIFSPDHVGNTHSMAGRDLITIYNPTASNPVPRALFPFGREKWVKGGLLYTTDWRRRVSVFDCMRRELVKRSLI